MSSGAAYDDALANASAFDEFYGLRILECSAERTRGALDVAAHHLQPTGVVHGGVYCSIAEALASFGTNQAVASRGAFALGLSNATSFLRPVAGGRILGSAEPRHRGRTTWVWDVELQDDEGRPCAISRVTIAVRPADDARRRP
ncbi:Uncharacterized protein possibly involved in aromatic compounds catabolism [Patulibacter medicamentivorans]|uniref:Uncharacterized protein possibly involved in aromatic compounds catabolism n=1 Tax=Patulibacter medicamentivorans TaxID=1097667 RepID=H0E003_9ACTN|nr:PaaI family thioesterase [Patulibacter medicamentivorans]EHN12962.1 Uncharacterized protein possibly involved in aromatic compounds catabolism [Patulibacter medicamentivorans]